jgi:hypothetical protein
MTTSSGARELDQEDLRRKQDRAEDGGHIDRDDEPPLPPRRWRPRKQAQGPLAPPKVS